MHASACRALVYLFLQKVRREEKVYNFYRSLDSYGPPPNIFHLTTKSSVVQRRGRKPYRCTSCRDRTGIGPAES